MRKLSFILALAMVICYANVSAQEIDRGCGSEEIDPTTGQGLERIQRLRDQMANRSQNKTTGAVRIIPVAVHVIYVNESDANNIDDAQINSQIPILNSDYRGTSGGVDTEIEFCLAGINRIQSTDYADVWLDTEEFDLKSLSQEDPTKYLNVWIVNTLAGSISNNFWAAASNPANSASFPWQDGIICEDNYWGTSGTAANNGAYNEGRTATHEIGHWLSLLHVFAPEGNCSGSGAGTCAWAGDCCCDTPPQKNPRTGCHPNANSCHGDSPDDKDPIRNYMGYSDDNCMDNFTQCQSDMMNAAIDVYRPNVTVGQPDDCPFFRFAEHDDTPPLLGQNYRLKVYPNPFYETTTIALDIVTDSDVVLEAFDMQGRKVAVIRETGFLSAGKYQFGFTPDESAGTYFIRAIVGNVSQSVIVRIQ